MIARTEFSFLLQLSNYCQQGVTASRDLIVSGVREFSWVLWISIFLCWLAYLAIMHMKSQVPRAWLPHTSREINQIAGGSVPLPSLNFEICERESYIKGVILRIPLYCKILMIVAHGWIRYQVKVLCIIFSHNITFIYIYIYIYIYIFTIFIIASPVA